MSCQNNILRRFVSDRKGNVSLLFAVSLIPMIGAGGAAVDYARASNARAKMQSALDAGAIAAAKDFTVLTNSQIKQRVEGFLTDLPASQFSVQPSVTVLSTDPNMVSVVAEACVKLAFSSFVSTVNPCIKSRSDVERPTENYLEIALVLDNSGSMSGSKIDAAKAAAKNFTQSVFNGQSDPQKVKVSVVPFTLTVNAGSGMNVASDPNLDRNGQSSIHWENLLPVGTPPPAGVTSRFSLYEQLGETWSGCFEMRPGTWGLNDAPPTGAVGDSLFVPMFAPDEPGPRAATWVRESLLNQQKNGNTYNLNNSYLNDDGSETINYDWSSGAESSSTRAACSAPISSNFSLPFSSPTASWQDKNWLNRASANICKYNLANTAGGPSGRKSISNTGGVNNGAGRGPNYMCNARPLQRLTATQGSAISKINEMTADGNTNILEGLMWGWRTISPNAPYGDGRAYNWNSQVAIGPGSSIRNRKFIIVMTDGDNYWASQDNPNKSIYSPFGYYRNNRLQAGINSDWDATLAMNAKARTACDNIKALRDKDNNEAVKIVTIGFSTPGQQISSTGLQLLQDCASMEGGQRLFYTATNATELSQVFSLIAANIGKLKLTR